MPWPGPGTARLTTAARTLREVPGHAGGGVSCPRRPSVRDRTYPEPTSSRPGTEGGRRGARPSRRRRGHRAGAPPRGSWPRCTPGSCPHSSAAGEGLVDGPGDAPHGRRCVAFTPSAMVAHVRLRHGCAVLASRLLVAHCASLASWWWPLVREAAGCCFGSFGVRRAVAGVTGLEPAACGFGDRCSAN